MTAIQNGAFGEQGFLIQVTCITKKVDIKVIHLGVLLAANLLVATATTFPFMLYLSKSNKKSGTEAPLFLNFSL